MAGNQISRDQVSFEWLSNLDARDLAQVRALFNASLELDSLIGFAGPIEDGTAEEYFTRLAADVEHGRKALLAARGTSGNWIAMVVLAQNAQPNCRHLAEVSKCIVHPEYRGQGILQTGLQHLLLKCREVGVERLVLDVRKGTRTESLWRVLGFEPFGELADYARVDGRVCAGVYLSGDVETLASRGRSRGEAEARFEPCSPPPEPQVAVSREQFRVAFLEYLRERNQDVGLTVSMEENLFNRGLLDSFALPQLIVHLEHRLGRRLDLTRGGVEAFFSVHAAFESLARAGRV